MDRREFLGSSLLGAGLAGCARGGSRAMVAAAEPMTDAEVRAFVAELDRQLEKVAHSPPMGDARFRRDLPPEIRQRADDLARTSIRTLLVAGSFSDLPLDARAHPAVQATVAGHMPEMDDAASGMRSFFASLTPTEKSDIARALRSDPNLAMGVVEPIDREAARLGVSLARRTHLRQLAAHVSGRMRQSAELLLDDTLRKVEKVAAQDTSAVAAERRLMTMMGEERFGRMREQIEAAASRWQVAYAGSAPLKLGRPNNGQGLLTAGGILMGLAAFTTTIGVLITAATGSIFGVIIGGATIGGILLITGLILLIIGAVLAHRSP